MFRKPSATWSPRGVPVPVRLSICCSISAAFLFIGGCPIPVAPVDGESGGDTGPGGGAHITEPDGSEGAAAGESAITLTVPGTTDGTVAAVFSNKAGEHLAIYGTHDGRGNVSQLDAFEYRDGSGNEVFIVCGADEKRAQLEQAAGWSLEGKINDVFLRLEDATADAIRVTWGYGGEYFSNVVDATVPHCGVLSEVASADPEQLSSAEKACLIMKTLACVLEIGGVTGATGVSQQVIQNVGNAIETVSKVLAFVEGITGASCEHVMEDILEVVDRALGGCWNAAEKIDEIFEWFNPPSAGEDADWPEVCPEILFLTCNGRPVGAGWRASYYRTAVPDCHRLLVTDERGAISTASECAFGAFPGLPTLADVVVIVDSGPNGERPWGSAEPLRFDIRVVDSLFGSTIVTVDVCQGVYDIRYELCE